MKDFSKTRGLCVAVAHKKIKKSRQAQTRALWRLLTVAQNQTKWFILCYSESKTLFSSLCAIFFWCNVEYYSKTENKYCHIVVDLQTYPSNSCPEVDWLWCLLLLLPLFLNLSLSPTGNLLSSVSVLFQPPPSHPIATAELVPASAPVGWLGEDVGAEWWTCKQSSLSLCLSSFILFLTVITTKFSVIIYRLTAPICFGFTLQTYKLWITATPTTAMGKYTKVHLLCSPPFDVKFQKMCDVSPTKQIFCQNVKMAPDFLFLYNDKRKKYFFGQANTSLFCRQRNWG